MKAFEVRINGKRVATVGVPEGMVTINVSQFSLGDAVPDARTADVRAMALLGEGRPTVHWGMPPLTVGDELTISIVEAQGASPAGEEWPSDAAGDDAP